MKKKTVVFISLLLALSLAACSIPLRDQTDPASTEAGGSAKVSEEEKTSPHNTMADTKVSSSSEPSRAQAESSPTTAVEPASSTAGIRQKLLTADIGSYVTFGSYEQDGNTANGKEEIEWLILDRDRSGKSVLLISKYALLVPQWDIYFADYDSIIDRHSVKTEEGDRWVWTDANARIEGTRQCVDRFYDWLKDETDSFYINAFSSEEKEQLVQDASQISILTMDELALFRNESQKRVPATKSAIQNGAFYDSTNGNTVWFFLRETDPDIGAAKVYEANETEDFNLGLWIAAISPHDPQSVALDFFWEETCLRPVIRMELEAKAEATLPVATQPETTRPEPTKPETNLVTPSMPALIDGYYSLWTAMQETLSSNYERDYDALEESYIEGEKLTFTMKSNGRYVTFTKDYIETTFTFDGHDEHGDYTVYNKAGEVIRFPVSPDIPVPSDFADYFAFCEWIFTEGAFELFCFYLEDGVVTDITTIS